MATALITGATAGIGLAFARRLAADGHGLVLVARDADRVAGIAAGLHRDHGVAVEVLPADLADRAQTDRVAARLADGSRPVGILVNNAGFGVRGGFVGGDLDDEQRMLDVMVTAPLRLCHAAVPGMVARGSGAIINVSSIAAHLPGSTYSADKAWLSVFTEGLAMELHGTGVTATAAEPGFTHTEFHQRAGMDMSGIPEWLWLSADDVVDTALRDAQRGRPSSVAGWQYRVITAAAKHMPHHVMRVLARSRPSRR